MSDDKPKQRELPAVLRNILNAAAGEDADATIIRDVRVHRSEKDGINVQSDGPIEISRAIVTDSRGNGISVSRPARR